MGGARPPCKCKTADAGQYTNNQIEKSRSPALLDDNHKVTNRGGIHQLQKSKREFDFFLSCALSGYEAIIRWKTVFFHCFFVPEALFLEKENSTPWILFVLNGIYSYKVEFTFTSDHRPPGTLSQAFFCQPDGKLQVPDLRRILKIDLAEFHDLLYPVFQCIGVNTQQPGGVCKILMTFQIEGKGF